MTARRPCPPALGPLEDYAAHVDAMFHSLAQRSALRTYLADFPALRECANVINCEIVLSASVDRASVRTQLRYII
nr:hypothetical protein [Noviherbaspirillum sedimenti]